MILDLKEIPEKAVSNFRGGEGIAWVRMFNDDMNRILMLRLQPGCTVGMHTHETNSEIMHILSGTARVIMDGEVEILHAGQTHYCPKGHTHMTLCEGTEDLVILAVVPEQ